MYRVVMQREQPSPSEGSNLLLSIAAHPGRAIDSINHAIAPVFKAIHLPGQSNTNKHSGAFFGGNGAGSVRSPVTIPPVNEGVMLPLP